MNTKNESYTVIHLSTGHLGGAGLAARRLNTALNHSGITSRFYALGKQDFVLQDNEYKIHRSIFIRIFSHIITKFQNRISSRIFFSLISLNALPKGFKKELKGINNPILHIHNWYNLINLREMRKFTKIGIPIVITLHDQRMMTGGCHYTFDCEGFTSSCSNCPGISLKLKKFPRIVLRRASMKLQGLNEGITFIAPSKWMRSQARKSNLLARFDTRFIPNVLVRQEIPIESIQSLKTVQLSGDFIVFGIASMDPTSFVKGGDIVSRLIQEANLRSLNYRFSFMNTFPQNSSSLEQFWHSIDYLLVFSRAENSPNVIHEAKYYGVPVIATKTGGITELLHPEFDLGIETSELMPLQILNKIEGFVVRHISNQKISSMYSQHNEYTDNSLGSHINLYGELITNKSLNR
ncbi:glycosyltransferase [Candidatus Planktophila versatilis]|uniref:glycosyltransferase n=1 Tax=Candidatus Planktophila versatilis TaxID=1884905 RepID=UPI003CF4F68E